MNISKRLEKMLEEYIKQTKLLSSKYEIYINKKNQYEELIELLNSDKNKILDNKEIILVFLSSIYENNTYCDKFRKLILRMEETQIYEFITNIIKDYNDLSNQIEYYELENQEQTELIESAQRIKISLKYNKPIGNNNNDIKNVEKILKQLQIEGKITNKEEILFINEIEHHDERLINKNLPSNWHSSIEDTYSDLPNIVTAGFQAHDTIEVYSNIKPRLNKFAMEIIDSIVSLSEEEIIEIVKEYKHYNLEDNEFNYILVKILDEYLEELVELYKLLLDQDIYRNKQSRLEVIKNYYDILNKYLIIQKIYNSETEYVVEETDQIIDEIDYTKEKKIIYSHSNFNKAKARLITDMSNIPNEYYDTVFDLLTRFKNGNINPKEIKKLINNKKFKGHIELRHDQVRIILKHYQDNVYTVLGVFAKKSDNDINMYGRIINRIIPNTNTKEELDMQLQISKNIEAELETIVKQKGRKGTR